MKVLWVCNIMLPVIANALGVASSHKEGWISGLCDILLERRQENRIELHVAYPDMTLSREPGAYCYREIELPSYGSDCVLHAYGFYEDVSHAEKYEEVLETRLNSIIKAAQPDVIHCFGTEFGHTLAVARCFNRPERILVGIQGVCQVIAEAYMADLPEEIQKKVTFRDWLKKDSMIQQQQKFFLRGAREKEILQLVGNVTGRTEFDYAYTMKCNSEVRYFSMNETLRSCFYEGKWELTKCHPYSIFVSQGDYPLKGLHYMLMAMGKLQERYPDIQLKIAGNSLVEYKTFKDKLKISAYGNFLRSLIKQYGLQDKVHFLGRLSAQEMKEQYLESGLYVCCSSNENSPNSLGEAMLLGVPCVAAKVGGISTICSDQKDGILYVGYVEQGAQQSQNEMEKKNNKSYLNEEALGRSVNNLTNAILSMWNDLDKMEIFSENARKHARNTHDKEANYQKMTEIYAKITGGKS